MLMRLVQIELIKMFSRWRTWIGFLILGIFIPLLIFAIHISGDLPNMDRMSSARFIRSGNLFNGWFMGYFVLNTLWVHLPILLTFAAGDLFAGEGAEGTWRYLLVRPVSRTQIFWAKWFTNVIYTFALILFMGVVTVISGLILEGGGDLMAIHSELGMRIIDGPYAVWFLLKAYMTGAYSMLVISTLSLFISVFVSNAIGPIIGAMGIVIVSLLIEFIDVSLFVAIRPIMFSHYMDMWNATLFSDVSPLYYVQGAGVQGLTILLLSLVGWAVFKKKEIQT